MSKKDQMKIMCEALQSVIRINPDNQDVEVRYYMMDDNIIANLGENLVTKFRLVADDEYIFFIKDAHILYVQNVSADSVLMAMAEASFLAACKF